MAIRTSYAKPKTGTVLATAHVIVQSPTIRDDTRQVVLRALVYASKADYDAGKAPEATIERILDTGYTPLRTALLNLIEPALITRYFPGGSRVPD